MVDLLRNDGSIILNKNLIFSLGHNATIVYSELLSRFKYFLEKDKLTDDGYFYNTVDDLRLGTGLAKTAQTNAINKLIDVGLIKKDLRGLPPKRHFKIIPDGDLLRKCIEEGRQEITELEEKLTENADMAKKDYNKRLKEYVADYSNGTQQTRNNTKVNNTKNNTKVYGRKQVSHSARFNYEEIRPQLNVSIESNELIQYFVDRYEFYIEREHPRLTAQQWNRVAETFNKDHITVIDEMDREKFIDINKAMINNYYQTSFGKEVDYCILHFIEPQILLNQWRKFN